jgi:hypothetical protein
VCAERASAWRSGGEADAGRPCRAACVLNGQGNRPCGRLLSGPYSFSHMGQQVSLDPKGEGAWGAVSGFHELLWDLSTEIRLCRACSCQEISSVESHRRTVVRRQGGHWLGRSGQTDVGRWCFALQVYLRTDASTITTTFSPPAVALGAWKGRGGARKPPPPPSPPPRMQLELLSADGAVARTIPCAPRHHHRAGGTAAAAAAAAPAAFVMECQLPSSPALAVGVGGHRTVGLRFDGARQEPHSHTVSYGLLSSSFA